MAIYSFDVLLFQFRTSPDYNRCFLTCIQVLQKAGKEAWYYHLVKDFPQFVVIYTVKDFIIVNETEVDVFMEFSRFFFFYFLMDVSYLISGSSAFSKSMGFSRQEYWSGLPFPSPGYLPDPGIESGSPTLQADSLWSEPPEKPVFFEGRTYMKRKCCNTIEKQSNSRCGFYASKYPNIYD